MFTPSSNPLTIDVLSDVVCPWCFIGKRRLEGALALFKAQFPLQAEPLVRWLPFQLNPDLPFSGIERSEYLRNKFGERAPSVYSRVSAVGQSVGIDFQFDRIERQPNTLLAHSLIAQAPTPAIQAQLVEGLFCAYFLASQDLTDQEVLAQIALSCGLTQQEIAQGLDLKRAQLAVLDKERAARELGINGVPFYIINSQLGVSGAQESQTLLDAMKEALSQTQGV